jgi:hypothetical protein
MKHNCLTYWGNQAAALIVRLDLGESASPGGGWAARLAKHQDHAALVLLAERFLAARDLQINQRAAWKRGRVRVVGLLRATLNVVGALEGDRLSTSSGHHDPNQVHWHPTGHPHPDAVDEMANVLWPKIRNALGR